MAPLLLYIGSDIALVGAFSILCELDIRIEIRIGAVLSLLVCVQVYIRLRRGRTDTLYTWTHLAKVHFDLRNLVLGQRVDPVLVELGRLHGVLFATGEAVLEALLFA